MSVSVLVLRAAGTNCDRETAQAFSRAGAAPEIRHLNEVLSNPEEILRHRILVIPGGFSYGDDVAAGRVFATEISVRLSAAFQRFLGEGGLLLGICNGFQVLVKTGLLPGPVSGGQRVTLTHNVSDLYEDRWVRLSVETDRCAFARRGEEYFVPIAHAEGRFVSDEQTLDRLEGGGQVVFRYRKNPNGSMRDIAGICDESGRVLGLMPHPERHVEPWQHPFWTRNGLAAEGDGLRLFRNAVRNLSG